MTRHLWPIAVLAVSVSAFAEPSEAELTAQVDKRVHTLEQKLNDGWCKLTMTIDWKSVDGVDGDRARRFEQAAEHLTSALASFAEEADYRPALKSVTSIRFFHDAAVKDHDSSIALKAGALNIGINRSSYGQSRDDTSWTLRLKRAVPEFAEAEKGQEKQADAKAVAEAEKQAAYFETRLTEAGFKTKVQLNWKGAEPLDRARAHRMEMAVGGVSSGLEDLAKKADYKAVVQGAVTQVVVSHDGTQKDHDASIQLKGKTLTVGINLGTFGVSNVDKPWDSRLRLAMPALLEVDRVRRRGETEKKAQELEERLLSSSAKLKIDLEVRWAEFKGEAWDTAEWRLFNGIQSALEDAVREISNSTSSEGDMAKTRTLVKRITVGTGPKPAVTLKAGTLSFSVPLKNYSNAGGPEFGALIEEERKLLDFKNE